jgi:hypothetical protein
MATSGNTSWELQRDDIIKSALRKLGVLAKGQTPSTEDYTDATTALNSLIQTLGTNGMPLWKRLEVEITPVLDQTTYSVETDLKIVQVYLSDNTSGTLFELIPKSLYDINRMPNSTTGQAVHYYLDYNLNTTNVVVWPKPDQGMVDNKKINVVYQKEFDGFISSTDTPDFPTYWTDALIYHLAVRLAPEYGLPLQDRQLLMQEAKMYTEAAEGYGDEDVSWFFQPNARRM